MKHRVRIFGLLAMMLLPASQLFAHGVEGTVQNGGLVVTAQYDAGEPMSYAKVNISAPGAKLPFQSGRTDRNGRFCFFPDAAGDWKIVADDEMGHRLELNVPVDERLALGEIQGSKTRGQRSLGRYEKALMGICIIFGGFGILSWTRRKKG